MEPAGGLAGFTSTINLPPETLLVSTASPSPGHHRHKSSLSLARSETSRPVPQTTCGRIAGDVIEAVAQLCPGPAQTPKALGVSDLLGHLLLTALSATAESAPAGTVGRAVLRPLGSFKGGAGRVPTGLVLSALPRSSRRKLKGSLIGV